LIVPRDSYRVIVIVIDVFVIVITKKSVSLSKKSSLDISTDKFTDRKRKYGWKKRIELGIQGRELEIEEGSRGRKMRDGKRSMINEDHSRIEKARRSTSSTR